MNILLKKERNWWNLEYSVVQSKHIFPFVYQLGSCIRVSIVVWEKKETKSNKISIRILMRMELKTLCFDDFFYFLVIVRLYRFFFSYFFFSFVSRCLVLKLKCAIIIFCVIRIIIVVVISEFFCFISIYLSFCQTNIDLTFELERKIVCVAMNSG